MKNARHYSNNSSREKNFSWDAQCFLNSHAKHESLLLSWREEYFVLHYPSSVNALNFRSSASKAIDGWIFKVNDIRITFQVFCSAIYFGEDASHSCKKYLTTCISHDSIYSNLFVDIKASFLFLLSFVTNLTVLTHHNVNISLFRGKY